MDIKLSILWWEPPLIVFWTYWIWRGICYYFYKLKNDFLLTLSFLNLFRSISSYISSDFGDYFEASLTWREWFVGILSFSCLGKILSFSLISSHSPLHKLEWNLFLMRKLDMRPHFFLLIPALKISEETSFYYSMMLESEVLEVLLKNAASFIICLLSDFVVLLRTFCVCLRRISFRFYDLCFSRRFYFSFFLSRAWESEEFVYSGIGSWAMTTSFECLFLDRKYFLTSGDVKL